MSCTSCEERTSLESTSQVFRIFPRSGMMAWNSRSRACFAESAESPSTRNSSVRLRSCAVQSASLPEVRDRRSASCVVLLSLLEPHHGLVDGHAGDPLRLADVVV